MPAKKKAKTIKRKTIRPAGGRPAARKPLSAPHGMEYLLRRYRELVELNPQTLFETDAAGRLTYMNENGLSTFGFARERFEAGIDMGALLDPADAARAGEDAARTLEGGDVSENEYTLLRADGTRFPALVYASRIMEGDRPAGLRGIVIDISEKKEIERAREAMEDRLRQAQKLESLGILAGGIAHDFNNLLTVILGNADLALLQLPPLSPSKEFLGAVVTAARRAADLTGQMLAYSGKGRFVVRLVDLSSVVEEMARLMRSTMGRGIDLSLAVARGLPPVVADGGQVRQVIMNLVINAAESYGAGEGAAPRLDGPVPAGSVGTVTVTTGVVLMEEADLRDYRVDIDLPPGRWVFLDVTDDGGGMTGEVCGRIFDPFFTTKFAGRGLGLAAVLGIVRAHQGGIRVRSTPGKGSSFRVILPAAEGTADADAPPVIGAPRRGTGTVLVVDDEAHVRELAKALLEGAGYRVLLAENGRLAVETFKEHPGRIDLVILDLTMPVMDGRETYRALRALDPGVRVVLSSGFIRDNVVGGVEGRGLAGFLQKPYSADDLLTIVAKSIEEARGS